jgi:hypothetical protein
MADFREFEDVQYVAGRNFQSEYGFHPAGSIVKEARQFQNLQVLVDAKVLYPYAPERGYEYLPPHIFNSIALKEEVMAKLEGVRAKNPSHFQGGRKPEAMIQAEREADQQRELIARQTNKGKPSERAKQTAAVSRRLADPDVNSNTKKEQRKPAPTRKRAAKRKKG